MNFTYRKPYHYKFEKNTLGKITSSEGIEEMLLNNKTEMKKKKIEEQIKETK